MVSMVIALSLALVIGATLGVLGGGGSILTVPMLAYVAGMETRAAITSSLFVVAVTSASAAAMHARAGRVLWRTGLVFGAAGMVGAFVGGRASALVHARVLMVLFAIIMIASAVGMLRRRRTRPSRTMCAARAVGYGAVVGAVTGLVGAGGGFIVVPVLVLFGRLPMATAVGTSLVVIAMSSAAGLLGHLGQAEPDWPITLAITLATVAGSFGGSRIVGHVDAERLRPAFGVLVLTVAVFVLATQLGIG